MVKLDKKLFWDVDFRLLDYRKHADFIISRVLQWGDLEDFKVIKKRYSLEKIKKVAAKLNFTNKKSQNFWRIIFNFRDKKYVPISY